MNYQWTTKFKKKSILNKIKHFLRIGWSTPLATADINYSTKETEITLYLGTISLASKIGSIPFEKMFTKVIEEEVVHSLIDYPSVLLHNLENYGEEKRTVNNQNIEHYKRFFK